MRRSTQIVTASHRLLASRTHHVLYAAAPLSTRSLSSSQRTMAAAPPAAKNVHVSAPLLPAAPHDSTRPLQLYPTLMSAPHPSFYPFGPIALPPSSIFFATPLSYASVNLSPIMPGHVLIMPRSNIARVTDLPAEQLCDLWLTAQHVARVFERGFGADALTLAIQDGAEAGQKVPCVHIHLIPRQPHDLANKDDIYGMIEENVPAAAADIPPSTTQASTAGMPHEALPPASITASDSKSSTEGTLRDSLDDEKRVKRSLSEMAAEARRFAEWMRAEGVPAFVQAHNIQLQMP